MRGVLRTMGKRPAKIRLRLTVQAIPTNGSVKITDIMFQPAGAITGWVPHITELPWSAGVVPGGKS